MGIDIEELRKKIIEFRDARDWEKYHNPKDLAISLLLEAGELLEVFQLKTSQEVEAIKSDPDRRERVKEELGDILIYALNICYAFGFNPSEVILEKLEINEKKYPVLKSKGNAKKYTES